MSPSLFNFFINDICDELDGFTPAGVIVPSNAPDDLRCPGLLIADDVVLMAESAEDLKAALMHVERWADRWGMECGVRKCGIMLVPTTLPTDSFATLDMSSTSSWCHWIISSEMNQTTQKDSILWGEAGNLGNLGKIPSEDGQ